jgi:CRP-like cAMP-binding protein/membrane protease YdiL (CAAX protease family)
MAHDVVSGDRNRPTDVNSNDDKTLLSHDLWGRSTLFDGITDVQKDALRSHCRTLQFRPGEFILREAVMDSVVYILTHGTAHVIKTTSTGDAQLTIAENGPGDVLGELKVVDPQPNSASIIAVTSVTVLAIDLDTFATGPALADARAIVLRNVGKILARRLRVMMSTGADAMQRELDESRARMHAGRFIVLMFAMLATYHLVISAFNALPGSIYLSFSTRSFILTIWTVIPVVLWLRSSPFSLESYGLTLRHPGRTIVQAMIWTSPLLLLVVAIKLAWIRSTPGLTGQPLFDPTEAVPAPFSLDTYFLGIFVYTVHAPLQELVARAGLQGALQNFIPTRPASINWKAIVISNLLFASAHVFISFWFSVAAFVPGLFWGWMFARQRSLLGVAASHISIGVWILFVVGVESFIGGQ